MNLQELTIVGPSDLTFHAEIQRFADYHSAKLRHGGQATVIIRNKPYVWRIWLSDPGFEKFLQYVAKNPNRHLPKVLSRVRSEPATFKRVPIGTTIKFVKLERLEETDSNDPMRILLDTLMNHGIVDSRVTTMVELRKFGTGLSETATQVIEENESFFEVYLDLIRKGANDLCDQNVMKRGSTYVITDPFNG